MDSQKKNTLECKNCGGKQFHKIVDDEDGLAWAVICKDCGTSMDYIEVEEFFKRKKVSNEKAT